MGNCKQKKKSSNEFVRTQGNTCTTVSYTHLAQLGIGNMVECGYCGEIYDEEDLEEDEDGEKLCPNCQHEIEY